MTREDDLDRFYDLLERLEDHVNGMLRLRECTGYMNWPDRGVYFFFANDEWRGDTDQRRLTRVGDPRRVGRFRHFSLEPPPYPSRREQWDV